MKTSLSLLLASTALTVAIGLPALAAMHASGNTPDLCGPNVCTAVFDKADQTASLIRVSGDDNDDDDDEGGWLRRGHDDDDDCDDEEEGDDDACKGAQGTPAAPTGTVAPPANGLFGNGAPPVAVTN